jgi:hypothetical protein
MENDKEGVITGGGDAEYLKGYFAADRMGAEKRR